MVVGGLIYMDYDTTDFRILTLLQKNARIKVSTIARDVHLSITAVNRRIEKMEDYGIISCGKEILLEFYFRDLDQQMIFYKSDIRKYLDSMTVYLVKGVPGKDSIIPLKLETME